MNQSEFEGNTCNWRQWRENGCEEVIVDFSFGSHLLKTLREF